MTNGASRKWRRAAAVFVAAAGLVGCAGGGHASGGPKPSGAAGSSTAGANTSSATADPAAVAGSKLQALIIKPEIGYIEDPTAGATGSISPAAFTSLGGSGSAAQQGFVSGYRENYVNYSTNEGLSITIIKFQAGRNASGYLAGTIPKTLIGFAPTVEPFQPVPGATELRATKAYSGEWAYGVVMAHGPYYASVVYLNVVQMTSLPTQFDQWATVQYVNLG